MRTLLPLAQSDDGILKLKAIDVSVNEFNKEWLNSLAQAMHFTMHEHQGISISAPQVYVSKRMILIASRPTPRYPDAPEMEAVIMINPTILAQSERHVMLEESCLSSPYEHFLVSRTYAIKVRFMTLSGELIEAKYEGIPARLIQHEIDHLNGITLQDRVV